MIYHFGLGEAMGCIYDDYASKQHLFSPGHHLPVLPPEDLAQRKPDYVLILAWRYVQPIVNKHQAYVGQGGHFIVPLPALAVL